MGKLPAFPRLGWHNLAAVAAVALAISLIAVKNLRADVSNSLLNVSYDPTRELYASLNRPFSTHYQSVTGEQAHIKQSHGGSSRQARSVVSLAQKADVVTLGLYSDVDALRKHGLIAEDWANRLPHHSQPYNSTIVFLVRKNNPKNIRDWPDLIKPGVFVITPDPQNSSNGKLSALAAWGAAIRRGASEDEARGFLRALYDHVPVLNSGARGATITFVEENVGDVLLTWENEALRDAAESKGELEIVHPPVSILAEPYVAWVDANVARNKTEGLAKAYLEFLFTDEAQEIIAKLGYRPINPALLEKYSDRLPMLDLFPITLIAKDWDDANQKFFAENGIVSAILKPKTY